MASDELVSKIIFKLISLVDNPGARLTESRLVEEFGGSRTPIRDALSIIQSAGLIERRHKKGISLRPQSIKELAELYDVRAVLEGLAGRQAADRVTDADIEDFERCLAAFQIAPETDDIDARKRADFAFHKKIIDLADNALLRQIVSNSFLFERSFLRKRNARDAWVENNPYSHEKILDALRMHDADECERLLQLHSQWTKQLLIELALGTRMRVQSIPAH